MITMSSQAPVREVMSFTTTEIIHGIVYEYFQNSIDAYLRWVRPICPFVNCARCPFLHTVELWGLHRVLNYGYIGPDIVILRVYMHAFII